MTLTLKTEIRIVEPSRATNATNITLEKQAWENGEIVAREDHATSFVIDPTKPDEMKAARAHLASLGDETIGLVPLSIDQIDQIMAVHEGFWTGPVAAPKDKPRAVFSDFVAHAIETQPEFADAKAAIETRKIEGDQMRAEMLSVDLGATKQIDK